MTELPEGMIDLNDPKTVDKIIKESVAKKRKEAAQRILDSIEVGRRRADRNSHIASTQVSVMLERIARILYEQRPAVQPWDGDAYAYHEPAARRDWERAQKRAEQFLPVLADVWREGAMTESGFENDQPREPAFTNPYGIEHPTLEELEDRALDEMQ